MNYSKDLFSQIQDVVFFSFPHKDTVMYFLAPLQPYHPFCFPGSFAAPHLLQLPTPFNIHSPHILQGPVAFLPRVATFAIVNQWNISCQFSGWICHSLLSSISTHPR